ncbi:hypothetical protein ElyMa_006488200 [Elysia marginata]|uniref:Uncharacterized protein n=1 Tax=Elysia marginata TaxID=1093978 RepID=A0AAV4I2L6_9GAST|nr:hypothetical protein ElyMa_006488200 [Elysia marginata]
MGSVQHCAKSETSLQTSSEALEGRYSLQRSVIDPNSPDPPPGHLKALVLASDNLRGRTPASSVVSNVSSPA